MDHTACTEPQCLYKGALYLTFILTGISGTKVRTHVSANKISEVLRHDPNHCWVVGGE